jgi:integration host factor subunit alpha
MAFRNNMPIPIRSDWRRTKKCPTGGSRGRNLTRDDLAIAVGKATPALSRAAARDLVDQFFSEIEIGLHTDRIVSLQGFGVFKVRSKAARIGRNPRSHSGAIYPIPAHEAVSFKASPLLRRAVEASSDADLANAAE